MKNEVISTSVPQATAEAIRQIAKGEDRTVSKIASRILAWGVTACPAPQARFARRERAKAEVKP